VKKLLILVGVVIVVGFGYWTISPLFITKEVNEASPISTSTPEMEGSMMASGSFSGLAGHNGKGTAQLIETQEATFVRFQEDFEVTNGPDLFVYLGKDGSYDPEANLGALKGNVGSQNYAIPPEIEIDKYNEVWVWCRAFSVPFAVAPLR